MTRRQKLEKRLKEIRQALAEKRSEMNKITDAALDESRDLDKEETKAFTEARSEREKLLEEEARLQGDLETLAEEERRAEEDAAEEARSRAEEDDEARREESRRAAAGGGVIVQREPMTYEKWDVRSSYLVDLARANPAFGLAGAEESRGRLQRHAQEMRKEAKDFEKRHFGTRSNPKVRYADGREDEAREARSGREQAIEYEMRDLSRTDGAGGEFVPPMWMLEDFIGLSRAGRVFADACRGIPLPGGTDSIRIPRVATGSSVAMQTADNAAVQETDITTNSVQGDVKTAAGQQDVALQLIEQSPIAFDQVIFQDLLDDHAVTVDTQAINGSNASGQVRGALQIGSVDTTTYTDATPTFPELYPKIADSANEVASNRLRRATAIFLHTRRWFWALAQLDADNRPFLVPSLQVPHNSPAGVTDIDAEGPVGSMFGATIYADPNIPSNLGAGTNEDRIIVTRPQEMYLFEGAVRTRTLPEVLSGNLAVRFQLYNFMAFIPDRRPESTSVVAGTGLVAPTF